jgi:hypothetical protein
VSKLATEFKDEKSLSNTILLDSGCFISQFFDAQRLELNLPRKSFESIFFENILQLYELLELGFLVIHFFLRVGSF